MTARTNSEEGRGERSASVAGGVPISHLPSAISQVSRRLLPFLFLLYTVNFLDRVNVSFAALQMNRDLGFSASVYGFGAGVFFIGYVLFGVPANALLLRIGVRRWLGGMMVVWGVISALTALIHRPGEFYLLRALLGFAEAGFFPGLIFYLAQWFPMADRARAIARCMIAVPVAGVIGGPLSGWILGFDGWHGVAGWRWLFVLEALPAVVLGALTWKTLPERPADARWLSPEERAELEAAIAADAPSEQPQHRPATSALPATLWVMAAIWLGVALVGYGWNLWLPQVLAQRSSQSVLAIGWLSAIPQLAGVAGALWFSAQSDRLRERRLPVALTAGMVVMGLLVLANTSSLPLSIAAFALMAAGQCGLWGPFWTLPSEYLSGAALATGVAIINSVGNIGGFLGPYLMGVLRDRSTGFGSGFLVLAGIQSLAVLLAFGLWKGHRPLAVSR
ncbi:MAG: MFS transporter [Gemmatimonadota bacterium]